MAKTSALKAKAWTFLVVVVAVVVVLVVVVVSQYSEKNGF